MPEMTRPWAIMTSEISGMPAARPPIAPNANMRMLPMKNAATVEATAMRGVREKRAKSGVSVPPEMNEPTTSESASVRLIELTSVAFISAPMPPTSAMEMLEE